MFYTQRKVSKPFSSQEMLGQKVIHERKYSEKKTFDEKKQSMSSINYDFPNVILKITKTWFHDKVAIFKFLLDFVCSDPDSIALIFPH